jgi:hypothetical protein
LKAAMTAMKPKIMPSASMECSCCPSWLKAGWGGVQARFLGA